jgi:hypothetical protein
MNNENQEAHTASQVNKKMTVQIKKLKKIIDELKLLKTNYRKKELLSELQAQISMLRNEIRVLNLENNELKIKNDKQVKALEEIANIVY